jgi:AcrR family transcriptional regulator
MSRTATKTRPGDHREGRNDGDESSRRQVILDGALACFSEHGYEATGISDIRARSGASVGSIYHHFGSKEGIATALFLDCLDHYRRGLTALLAEVKKDDAEGLIRGIVRFHLQWSMANPERARYLHTMRQKEPVVAQNDEVRRGNNDYFNQVFQRFKDHIEQGRIRNLPSQVIFVQLIGPPHEMLRLWFANPNRFDPGTAIDDLTTAAWRALKRDDQP